MAWTTAGTGDSIVSTKGSVWVSMSEYDKLKQKLENCEEQNQRFRKKIKELEDLVSRKLNPIEKLGYAHYISHYNIGTWVHSDNQRAIRIYKAENIADFIWYECYGDIHRSASVEEMKAVAEYLEGEDKWKK